MENYWIIDYLNYCKDNKRLSEHSIRAYRNDLNQFLQFNNFNVEEYITHLGKQKIKSKTLKRKIATLKTFFRYLENQEVISENPFYKLRFHFRDEKKLPKIITPADLKIMYSYLFEQKLKSKTTYQKEKSHRNLLILSLLISTGVRISELCHITLENINTQSREITILGKGKKERILYVGSDETYSLLIDYIDTYRVKMDKFLFLGHDKKTSLTEQSVRLLFKSINKKLGIEKNITPHMFRHTFATMLLDSGVDIRYIQQILGHSSIAVTQIYTYVSQIKQQEILVKKNPINSIF
ncbi:tyrosine-type recombinase/integrase [Lactococcus lactis]|uniref:tyrosine-type recombinase/integrase n=1 Tax=Lactococcus lactis TaxID=1358 RepID=UPI0024188036|nr:tyrosine-type recombinase/integrase [Lactococcus lactis]MDG4965793.1 tyrosine-type recombinase/integrase [Lactococcus lactis]